MHRWLLLLVVLSLFVNAVHSQPGSLQVGGSAGASAAIQTHRTSEEVRSEFNFDTSYLVGPAVSIFIVKPVTSHFAVRGGVGSVRKGHRRKGRLRPDITEVIRLDVFTIRLGGEVGMPIGWGIWGYGVLEPRMDVVVGQESEFEVDGRGRGAQPTRLRYDTFVFGGILGVGLRFDAGIGRALQLEGHVDQDIAPAYSSNDVTVRGRAFVFSVGILF